MYVRKVNIGLAMILSLVVCVGSGWNEETTIIFQEGRNGYSGTQDSYIQTGAPDQNNNFWNHNENKIWEIEWDGSDAGGRNFALFWFPDIFGDGENQIPLGATILNAELRTMVINDGSRNEGDSIYRLTKSWDQETVTFSNYFTGADAAAATSSNSVFEDPQFVGPNPIIGALHIPNMAGSAYKLNLTPIVQEWSDGSPNFGFMITVNVGAGNGFGHIASEASIITRQFIEDQIAAGREVDEDIADPAFAGFDVNISPALIVETPNGTFTFQYGANGYESYQDAWISSIGLGTEPDNGVTHLWSYPLGEEGVIRCNITDTGVNDFGLVRFDNIIGTNTGQIPPGTQIDSARIRFFVTDDGNAVQVYQIKRFTGPSLVDESITIDTDWDEKTVTFANFVQDGLFPQLGGELTDSGVIGEFVPSSEFRFAEADVTVSVQAYSDGTAENLGWMFEGADVHFAGKEAAAVFGAPALVITYDDGETVLNDFMLF